MLPGMPRHSHPMPHGHGSIHLEQHPHDPHGMSCTTHTCEHPHDACKCHTASPPQHDPGLACSPVYSPACPTTSSTHRMRMAVMAPCTSQIPCHAPHTHLTPLQLTQTDACICLRIPPRIYPNCTGNLTAPLHALSQLVRITCTSTNLSHHTYLRLAYHLYTPVRI